MAKGIPGRANFTLNAPDVSIPWGDPVASDISSNAASRTSALARPLLLTSCSSFLRAMMCESNVVCMYFAITSLRPPYLFSRSTSSSSAAISFAVA